MIPVYRPQKRWAEEKEPLFMDYDNYRALCEGSAGLFLENTHILMVVYLQRLISNQSKNKYKNFKSSNIANVYSLNI